MLLVQNERTNPYYNLAMEEFMLTHFDEDCFSLWINEAVVVVGKNQNTLAEINHDYVERNNICVVRRLTGGGAVFHDVGNVNFTYIENASGGRFNDYAHFTRDILDFLETLGVHGELSGRNDLTVDGKKFSGNAQCMRGGRVLHHGTILFSADLSRLAGALNANPLKMQSKGIKSVSSRVTNLRDHLKQDMDVGEFKRLLEQFMLRRYKDLHARSLTPQETAEVEELTAKKYATWQWNYGSSPEYNFKNAKRFENGGIVELRMQVSGGVIRQVAVNGDFFGVRDIADIETALTGVRHEPQEIARALEPFDISEYISGVTREQFTSLFQ